MDKRTYCLIGDGESREGQVTEALNMMIDAGLRNVLPIFNCNGYGQANKVIALDLGARARIGQDLASSLRP